MMILLYSLGVGFVLYLVLYSLWNERIFLPSNLAYSSWPADGLLELLVLVMKADGNVSTKERKRVCAIFKRSFKEKKAREMYDKLNLYLNIDYYGNNIFSIKKKDGELCLNREARKHIQQCVKNNFANLTILEQRAVFEFLFAVVSVDGITPRERMVVDCMMEYFDLTWDTKHYFEKCYMSYSKRDTCGTYDNVCWQDMERESRKQEKENRKRQKNENKERRKNAREKAENERSARQNRGNDKRKKNARDKDGNEQGAENRPTQQQSLSAYYAILGVPATATPDEVKQAYRKLVKIYHPDMVQDEMLKTVYTEKFKAINNAYRLLAGQ